MGDVLSFKVQRRRDKTWMANDPKPVKKIAVTSDIGRLAGMPSALVEACALKPERRDWRKRFCLFSRLHYAQSFSA